MRPKNWERADSRKSPGRGDASRGNYISKQLRSKRGCEHLEGISSSITAMSVLLSLFFFFFNTGAHAFLQGSVQQNFWSFQLEFGFRFSGRIPGGQLRKSSMKYWSQASWDEWKRPKRRVEFDGPKTFHRPKELFIGKSNADVRSKSGPIIL